VHIPESNLIMKNKLVYVISLIAIGLVLFSCSLWYTRERPKDEDILSSPLIDLIESTHIIRTLIVQNKLESLLEDYDPEKLVMLLDNVSPAKMAFESEVLSTTVPLVVVYYFQENEESKIVIQELKNLAVTYDNRIKFVVIDVDKLFSLAQDAEIENHPTILLVRNREIIKRYVHMINVYQLEQEFRDYYMGA